MSRGREKRGASRHPDFEILGERDIVTIMGQLEDIGLTDLEKEKLPEALRTGRQGPRGALKKINGKKPEVGCAIREAQGPRKVG